MNIFMIYLKSFLSFSWNEFNALNNNDKVFNWNSLIETKKALIVLQNSIKQIHKRIALGIN